MANVYSTCLSVNSRNAVPSPEILMWGAKLHIILCDAIHPFSLPSQNMPSLQAQYEKMMKDRKDKPRSTKLIIRISSGDPPHYKISGKGVEMDIGRALWFFEHSCFDWCLEAIGRENQAKRIFDFAQEAVTLRRKYNIACLKDRMKVMGLKMSDLTEESREYIKWRPRNG